jgi:hypothetical protein
MSMESSVYELHTFRSAKFRSVVKEAIEFFNNTPVRQLPPERFGGTGVYALYYRGKGDLYAALGELNAEGCTQPIYVGKAVPRGWRTGRKRVTADPLLYRRLREHTHSITQADNLIVNEFSCRFMILSDLESDLVIPVEAELIRLYQPLWNAIIDGFGNHDPGMGRYNQAPSEWDTLHPGRVWAKRLKGEPPSKKAIMAKVSDYLRRLPFT